MQAHDEFEVVSPDLCTGTTFVCRRADLHPDIALERHVDQADFVGRMITRFGARPERYWTLRCKRTGTSIVAHDAVIGPSYRAKLPDSPPHDAAARHAAMMSVIARLDALVAATPPSDWQTTDFDDAGPSVWHFGVDGGRAFSVELPSREALAFALQEAEAGRLDDRYVLEYYASHRAELADQRPRALTAYVRYLSAAEKADPETRASMLEIAELFAP